MIDAREDLWPSDFPGTADPSPVALLKEQAELLSRKTNGEIEGVVRMTIENGIAYQMMYLRARPVNDLMVAILSISYPAFADPHNVYPITADPQIDGISPAAAVIIANDEEFREWLRQQLASTSVMSAIGVLRNYIRDLREARAS